MPATSEMSLSCAIPSQVGAVPGLDGAWMLSSRGPTLAPKAEGSCKKTPAQGHSRLGDGADKPLLGGREEGRVTAPCVNLSEPVLQLDGEVGSVVHIPDSRLEGPEGRRWPVLTSCALRLASQGKPKEP